MAATLSPSADTVFELNFSPAPDGRLSDADVQRALNAEWLLTTGNGGFAMGTALGVNRRKYHSVLVASAHPPVERWNLLNLLAERVTVAPGTPQEARADLYALRFADGRTEPRGFDHLVRFEKHPDRCVWVYRAGSAEIVRTLRMGQTCNRSQVQYRISCAQPVSLLIRPFVTVRDFHSTLERAEEARYTVRAGGRELRVGAQGRELVLSASAPAGSAAAIHAQEDRAWQWSVSYDIETARHQGDTEHLFSPGWVLAQFPASPDGAVLTLGVEMSGADAAAPGDSVGARSAHRVEVISRAVRTTPALRGLESLVAAADDFLVQRRVNGAPLTTVIAGYPWFADWGRDTMISLPGLMLATGRFDEAKQALITFARHERDGLIPNRFDDYGGEPEYNTVDAPLWFLHACAEYVNRSGDRATFDRDLLPACVRIVHAFRVGTRNKTFMDPADGLVTSGDATTQLTWMDAKRDGVVFTPRHGKAVEINALWHHGLRAMSALLQSSDPAGARDLQALADRAGASFRTQFARPDGQGLFDVLQPADRGMWKPSALVRPNQIFAASLEHSPLTHEERRAVVQTVRAHLLTPLGLRTLGAQSPGYKARFEGTMMERDAAYHNGTVWPWLIGPYAEAVLRAGGFSAEAKAEARRAVQPLIDQMSRGPIGTICEVYDAEEPRRAQGCMAQAWSVAEVLRVCAMIGG